MGLDITAYRRITKLDVVLDSDDEPVDPITREPVGHDFRAYLNADFPGRADEIEDRAIYSAEDSMCLHAGGYGRYNHWREQLAELAGYIPEDYEQYGRVRKSHCLPCWNGAEGPFAELINFSDCEGVIGCSVSAKLAKDFAELQSKADSHKDEYFRAKYTEWRKAFEMAADQGAVEFH